MESDVFVTVKKVKSGDERAFSELCEKYSALVSVSADKYCRMLPENSNATPEDFEQEAYLALYRAAVTYDTDQTDVTFGLYSEDLHTECADFSPQKIPPHTEACFG